MVYEMRYPHEREIGNEAETHIETEMDTEVTRPAVWPWPHQGHLPLQGSGQGHILLKSQENFRYYLNY